MTSKEFLSQAFLIDQKINDKLEQIQALRDLLTKANAIVSDMPRNPNKDRSRIDEYTVKIVDMENEIDAEVDRLVTLKADIMHAICLVEDDKCRMLLEERYLQYKTWEDIAASLGYTVRNVHLLHGRALGLVKVPYG